MELYNDLEIIQGIRKRDNTILKYLYNEYFDGVYKLVAYNNGSEDDARDTLQEAIILIYKKITNESLELNTTFESYFLSVCSNIWKHELRRREREVKHILNYAEQDAEFLDFIQSEYEQQQKYRLYQEHFNKLGKECRKLLRMYLRDFSFSHIAKTMKLKSESYARKRKKICKEHLVKSIKKDKRFKGLS